MRSARLSLFAVAVPAFAASLLVLAMAGVGKVVWLVHLGALGLTCAIAAFARLPRRSMTSTLVVYALCLAALVGIGAPLLGPRVGPQRWLRLGPFTLYMAPLLLPALLVSCVALRQQGRKGADFALVALSLAGVVLAVQPDASQVLALLAATVVLCATGTTHGKRQWAAVVALALAALWAFAHPDPLQPVPYVEGVFALALGRSPIAGAAVITAAGALLVGLGAWASRHAVAMFSVAAWFAVLFACSGAGLTPAPLIGYGAGPLLGYGLMVAVAASVSDGLGGERGAPPRADG